MNETRLLSRMLAVFETLHVFVLSCCLTIPLLFFVQEFSDEAELCWALGAALPVLALHLCGRKTTSKKILLPLGLGLWILCLLVCRTTILRFVYSLALLLQLLIQTVVPKPKGKPLLSVPSFWHAPMPLLIYCLARAMAKDAVITIALSLTVLYLVNTLLYLQASRLQRALYEQSIGAVSDRGIVRLNLRMMTVYCIVGAIAVVAVPLLLSARPAAEAAPAQAVGVYESAETESQAPEPLPPIEITTLPAGDPIRTEPFTDAILLILGIFTFIVLGLAVYAMFSWLFTIDTDKLRHRKGQEDGFVVEQLDTPEERRRRPQSGRSSWSGRIRRLYQKLIRSKTEKGSALHALTPTELEQAASLEGSDRQTLHMLYEKARYANTACDKSDYLSARAAAQRLKKGDPHA